MEPHDHQGPESGFYYNPQQGNIWSKPSEPTMKQNMKPSYPDWPSPWLYPSPSSVSIVILNLWSDTSRRNMKLKMSAWRDT